MTRSAKSAGTLAPLAPAADTKPESNGDVCQAVEDEKASQGHLNDTIHCSSMLGRGSERCSLRSRCHSFPASCVARQAPAPWHALARLAMYGLCSPSLAELLFDHTAERMAYMMTHHSSGVPIGSPWHHLAAAASSDCQPPWQGPHCRCPGPSWRSAGCAGLHVHLHTRHKAELQAGVSLELQGHQQGAAMS